MALKATAIVVAGGKGRRFGAEKPKQLATLAGRAVLAHALEVFERAESIDAIVLVAPRDFLPEHRAVAADFRKARRVVEGGATRQASSFAGVEAAGEAELVLIHDAVRPFVTEAIVDAAVAAAGERGACVVAVPSVDTILEARDGFLKRVLDREPLMNMQTPQGFRREVIAEAHRKALADGVADATDDVTLVLRAGGAVAIVEGSYENIKVTTPGDLALAETIAASRL